MTGTRTTRRKATGTRLHRGFTERGDEPQGTLAHAQERPQRPQTTPTENLHRAAQKLAAGQGTNYEGTQAVAELAAIFCHAISPRAPAELPRPNRDPIVALAISRTCLGEYARADTIDRALPFPGDRL